MNDEYNAEGISEEDSQYGKYLTFILGDENYGIEIRHVTEIIGLQTITQVPELPNYMKGIINLRGKIIPVIDVRLKFKKDPITYDDRTCIIVVNINDSTIGLIVDQVDEVLAIPDDRISPPPDVKTGYDNGYIKGIGRDGERINLLLDCYKFVKESDFNELISTA